MFTAMREWGYGSVWFFWFVTSVILPPIAIPNFVFWHLLFAYAALKEPDYEYGPRGGRYTIEDSRDGGEYKRYR